MLIFFVGVVIAQFKSVININSLLSDKKDSLENIRFLSKFESTNT